MLRIKRFNEKLARLKSIGSFFPKVSKIMYEETFIVAGKIFKKRFGKRALSPVISTVILTGAIVALLSITLV